MVIHLDETILSGLSYNEKRLLLALDGLGGSGTPAQLIAEGGFSLEVEVVGSASWLQSKGLAVMTEEVSRSSRNATSSLNALSMPIAVKVYCLSST